MSISAISPSEFKALISNFTQQMADEEQQAIDDQKKADQISEAQANS